MFFLSNVNLESNVSRIKKRYLEKKWAKRESMSQIT